MHTPSRCSLFRIWHEQPNLACVRFIAISFLAPVITKTAPMHGYEPDARLEPSAHSPRLMMGKSSGERVMNNFSLLAANRVAHLKVLMVALILATLVEWGYAIVVLSEPLR